MCICVIVQNSTCSLSYCNQNCTTHTPPNQVWLSRHKKIDTLHQPWLSEHPSPRPWHWTWVTAPTLDPDLTPWTCARRQQSHLPRPFGQPANEHHPIPECWRNKSFPNTSDNFKKWNIYIYICIYTCALWQYILTNDATDGRNSYLMFPTSQCKDKQQDTVQPYSWQLAAN